LDFKASTRISFTPEAKAVLGDYFTQDNLPRRIGTLSAVGDLVRFPECAATFVVSQRVWTYGQDFEELQLILEVNNTPGLRSVGVPEHR